MNPMNTFEPAKSCMLHDELNDSWFRWDPREADRYRKYAVHWDTSGAIAFDGLLLDGWAEIPST
jgi:hypothetical protein